MRMIGPPSATKAHVSSALTGLAPTPLFVNEMFPALWDAGLHSCVDPVGLLAQSYKETGGGAFGGKVKPKFYNTAGIKARHNTIRARVASNHSRHAGCGGVQGLPLMASRSAVRTSSPCLRTVEM